MISKILGHVINGKSIKYEIEYENGTTKWVYEGRANSSIKEKIKEYSKSCPDEELHNKSKICEEYNPDWNKNTNGLNINPSIPPLDNIDDPEIIVDTRENENYKSDHNSEYEDYSDHCTHSPKIIRINKIYPNKDKKLFVKVECDNGSIRKIDYLTFKSKNVEMLCDYLSDHIVITFTPKE